MYLKKIREEIEAEKRKIEQNQQRLNSIEQLLNNEYCNEKLKIKQNQERLDRIEKELWSKKKSSFNFLNKITNSQSGEDAILAYIVANLKIPFEECNYLDLGANRPVEGSNTNFFYSCGARGVLVDANPELIDTLKEARPRDQVLNSCIGITTGKTVTFYIMSDDGLSTTDPDEVKEIQKINPEIELKKIVEIPSITVNEIMETYFEDCPLICSIDIEGQEMDILKSIDFKQYRPLLFVIEMIEYSDKIAVGGKNTDIICFMESVGYKEYAFTGINSIFIDTVALKEKWKYDL